MDTIAVSAFTATCLAGLERVRRPGRPRRVRRFGEPLADIVPPAPARPRGEWPGSLPGTLEIWGDILTPSSARADREGLR